MNRHIAKKNPEGPNPALEVTSCIRLITSCTLALILIFALLPFMTVAGAKGSLDEQLREAVWHGNFERAKKLLARGADVNATSTSFPDGTVLMLALSPVPYGELPWVVGPKELKMVKLLLDKGADVNATNSRGATALMAARGTAVAKLLLDKGADVNAQDSFGMTALMGEVRGENVDTVKLLLAKGADVNSKSKSGDTALMFAVNTGYADLVKILLEKGADVEVKNRQGFAALREAEIRNDREILALLKRADALNGTTKKEQTVPGAEQADGNREGDSSVYPDTPEAVVKAFVNEALGATSITIGEMRSCDDILLSQDKYFTRLREHVPDQQDNHLERAGNYNIATGFTIKQVTRTKDRATVKVLYRRLGWIWDRPIDEYQVSGAMKRREKPNERNMEDTESEKPCESVGDKNGPRFLHITKDTQEVTYALTKPVDAWRLVHSYYPYISASSAIQVLECQMREASRDGKECPSDEQRIQIKQDIKLLQQHLN